MYAAPVTGNLNLKQKKIEMKYFANKSYFI